MNYMSEFVNCFGIKLLDKDSPTSHGKDFFGRTVAGSMLSSKHEGI